MTEWENSIKTSESWETLLKSWENMKATGFGVYTAGFQSCFGPGFPYWAPLLPFGMKILTVLLYTRTMKLVFILQEPTEALDILEAFSGEIWGWFYKETEL